MRPLPLLRAATPAAFSTSFFAQQAPCSFPPAHFSALLPAIRSWFTANGTINASHFSAALTPSQLSTLVTVEATTATAFARTNLPFGLLLRYLSQSAAPRNLPSLYLAQIALLDLFPTLRLSLPTPEIVTATGRGDLYATNVWLGFAAAIETPLHKDPNPNLFVQLAGRKRVRLFAPDRWQGGAGLNEEAMAGSEKGRLGAVVWEGGLDGFEVELGPGDGIFIPREWWHAVRGFGEGVAGSVNWWFR